MCQRQEQASTWPSRSIPASCDYDIAYGDTRVVGNFCTLCENNTCMLSQCMAHPVMDTVKSNYSVAEI